MINHGGDIDRAISIYGGKQKDWIDLSTGINPEIYPIPKFSESDWRNLPTLTEIKKLKSIIKFEYNTFSHVSLTPGSQIAINLLPGLLKKREVTILEPTYGDYLESFVNAQFKVRSCKTFKELFNAKIAVIVNPNNPDGRSYYINDLLLLSKKVDMLIIDESFIETPGKISLISQINESTNNIIVIKSFGKIFGLAGLRLGFVFSGKNLISRFNKVLSSWPVSNLSIIIASRAIKDKKWIKDTLIKLKKRAKALDDIIESVNFRVIGGTNLFRLYYTPDAILAQSFLAKKLIWSRIFFYSKKWLRLGIPNEKQLKEIKKRFNFL